jgi:hypothetical protein
VVPVVVEILGVLLQGRGVGERPFRFAKQKSNRLPKHQAEVEAAPPGSANTFQTLSKPKATIFKA